MNGGTGTMRFLSVDRQHPAESVKVGSVSSIILTKMLKHDHQEFVYKKWQMPTDVGTWDAQHVPGSSGL